MSHLRGHIGYFANVFLECVLFMFFWYVAPMWENIYKRGKERSQWCERVLSDSLFISTWYILFFLAIKGNGPLVDMDPQGETVLVWVFQPNEHFPAITLVTILLVESGSKSYYIQKLIEPYCVQLLIQIPYVLEEIVLRLLWYNYNVRLSLRMPADQMLHAIGGKR